MAFSGSSSSTTMRALGKAAGTRKGVSRSEKSESFMSSKGLPNKMSGLSQAYRRQRLGLEAAKPLHRSQRAMGAVFHAMCPPFGMGWAGSERHKAPE